LVVLLFTHVYTWSVLIIIMTGFLASSLVLNYYTRKDIILLLIAVLSSIIVYVGKTYLTGSYGGIGSDIQMQL
jgi:hypothetical protein